MERNRQTVTFRLPAREKEAFTRYCELTDQAQSVVMRQLLRTLPNLPDNYNETEENK